MKRRKAIARMNAARGLTRLLSKLTPQGVYVLNLRGLDEAAVRRHLRRCCGPALCCSEMIADAMEGDGNV